jgi:hypothetical protein
MNEALPHDRQNIFHFFSFNPLFIGSMNEAEKFVEPSPEILEFQSPFHRVNE